jgi:hypothetical protein
MYPNRGFIDLGDAKSLDKCQCDREKEDLALKIGSQGDSEKTRWAFLHRV